MVALNFTLNAEYGALSSSDNTVRRLLAVKTGVALSLVVNLTLFRFDCRCAGLDITCRNRSSCSCPGGALAGAGDRYRYLLVAMA